MNQISPKAKEEKNMPEIIKQLDAQQFGIDKSRAEQIESVFVPMVARLKEFESDHADIISESKNGIDEDLTKRAKRLRIDIGRCGS